ncbi:MAG: efflux RND transporter permease subunit, partial [Lutibacter sp.]|nr:efflux RND transporter permease subunit [Lutibacter sp.]
MNKVLKEFKLSTWSIHNKMTVFVLIVMIFLAGIFSYQSMPREAFPEIVIPQIYVSTPYPGNSAIDIEKLITRPLEKEINGISGVDEIISTSIEGFSSIQVSFDFSITPTEALRKVKDKVDAAKSDKDFPTDLPADPTVQEMNFAELIPIMNINLSGDFSMDQLKEYAEFLEDEIEKVPEISKVDIRGIQDKEIEISVDLYKMEISKISFNDIAMAIQNENMTVSGGDLLEDGIRRNVRIIGEFKSAKEIENVIVKQENNNIVYLRDIAKVSFKEQEKQSYAREFSHPVVMLDVTKRGGENLIKASTQIDEIIKKAKENYFPSNLNISKTNDQTNDTKTMVSDLENSIILGILLVVIVLLFFLGLRNALFVGIAIPLSMFISFIILSAFGVTLNTMVLFSLVIALGMLVDNGIVVVENVYRLLDEGYSKIDAAKFGVGEVAMPIIASTATTLAAFLPIAFWPGIMGEFMRYLPITLII